MLFKHDSGDISVLNVATATYIINKNTPDELDVVSVEDLMDLENGILLEHIDKGGSRATQTSLSEVIAENLCIIDEDAPENCEHFKQGKCKFQVPLF